MHIVSRRLLGLAVIALAVALPTLVRAANRPAGANHARDGNIAVREEYDAARRNGSPAALRLFLERHPDSIYAPRVRRMLRIRR